MLMVGNDAADVEEALRAGGLTCPDCGGELRPWWFARSRTLRAPGMTPPALRPRRSRCRACGVTHVLLPVIALVRRADLAEVIGSALLRRAAGAGHRTIGQALVAAFAAGKGIVDESSARAAIEEVTSE